jgi:hypothetical protein
MTVGADVDNGKYAMLGARIGCYKTVLENQDCVSVRDLDTMEQVYFDNIDGENIDNEIEAYGESLRQRLDIPVAEYDENQSRFFKYAMRPHVNMGVQQREQK